MAFSNQRRRELLALRVPEDSAMRDEISDYLARTGLHADDFARRIGYSGVSVRFFLQDRYAQISGDSKNLRVAARNFMDANPIGLRNQEGGSLYRTANVKLLEKYFQLGLARPVGTYIYGPPGTQKSFILKRLIEELVLRELPKNGTGKRAYYVYCRAGIRPLDLMKRIAEAAGIPAVHSIDRILRNMRFELRNRRALICLDEAQHLDNNAFEVVRELLDEPPHCSLLFAGSHNLKQIFQQLEMEQLHSRLHEGAVLPGLSEEEARQIARGELGEQPERKVEALIKQARTADLRQGKDFTYIHARKLFWAVRDIKAALAEKNGGEE